MYRSNGREASDRTPLLPAKQADALTPPESAADGPTPASTSNRAHIRKRGLCLVSLVVFLFMVSDVIAVPVVVQYVYQVYTEKAYGNTSVTITKTPCVNTTNTNASSSEGDKLRDTVQNNSASFMMWLEVITFSTGSVACLFLGTYSDVIGRRLVLFLPMLGHFLRNASVPIIIHWDLRLPALYAGYAVYGVCGGTAGILLGSYVYSADVMVSEKERTVGVCLMLAATGAGTAVTQYAAGVFIEQTGFFFPALASSFGDVLAILIIVLLLPETVSRDPHKRLMSAVDSVKRIFNTFLSHDNSQQRVLLLILLIAFFIGVASDYPTQKLDALYLMNEPFCWNASKIGLMVSIKYGVARITSVLLLLLLQRFLSTASLAILGTLSFLATNLMNGLATTDLLVYLGAGAAFASMIMYSAMRAMMSRMVPDDRQGALFGGIAVLESVVFGVSQLVVFSLYRAVVSTRPGITYIYLSGCFGVIIVLLM